VILSGSSTLGREWAGVGFIVAPKVNKSVVGYCQYNNRMASLKVKTTGGVFAVLSVYAPHNLKDVSEKYAFYDDLGKLLKATSTNGPRLIYGDFNARLGPRRVGEQNVLGEFSFGREAQHRVEVPNRELLMEFCIGNGYAVAQTFFQQRAEDKVTYHELSTAPMDTISVQGFAVLDLLLVPQAWLENVRDICSDRYAALASHHFLLYSTLDITITPPLQTRTHSNTDWGALQDSATRQTFLQELGSLPDSWGAACSKVAQVAEATLPKRPKPPNKPWITTATLELVASRQRARATGNWTLEKQLRKQIQKSAKQDRAKWLEELSAKGDWSALRLLRKGRKVQQGRLYNVNGDPVCSDERAETFAKHLASVQWHVRPVTLIPDTLPPIAEPLGVSSLPFSSSELSKAIQRMSGGKATKRGDIPIEAFKALAADGGAALTWTLDFCNSCWASKSIPHEWSMASVSMIYKKGDPGFCDNYRPICLLSIGYKLFSSMLKQRLLDAGIEKMLWASQFGFRQGCSTEEAIFIARRRIELARAQRHGRVSLLALDWKKAFDSINVTSLLDALRRAGLPESFLQMVDAMLDARQYSVQDSGTDSELRAQLSGISQGCTLSPLLFIIAMTVLLHDAVGMLGEGASAQYACGDLADLVYADDTLLIGINEDRVQEYLAAVYEAGRRYGMELHFGKFQLISTTTGNTSIVTPDGTSIEKQDSMEYLGASLHGDGTVHHEVIRRIAFARSDFQALSCVWSRSALTWTQKVHIFSSLVESRLLYSLASFVLTKALERKLDGFQNRCLRKILGIAPSYISRVANATVLCKSGHIRATCSLRKRRLQLFGKILRCPSGHPLRDSCFIPGTWTPAVDRYVRRVGRPCKEWVKEAITDTAQLFGSLESALTVAADKVSWSAALTDKLEGV